MAIRDGCHFFIYKNGSTGICVKEQPFQPLRLSKIAFAVLLTFLIHFNSPNNNIHNLLSISSLRKFKFEFFLIFLMNS
jgi:hypothetical protein